MHKNDRQAFVSQLLIYTLVMICFTGSIGLGTVWLRNQMARTANSIKTYEYRTAEIERRIAETTAMIAVEQAPASLIQRNKDWQLGLVAPTGTQVVRIGEDPEQRLASRRGREIFTAEQPTVQPVKFVLGATH